MFRRAQERDDDLPRVYRENVDSVYAFFAYSVGASAAEDLTASTFERVIRAWRRFDPSRSRERTWILAIAQNLLTDHFRREKRRPSVSTDEYPGLLDRLTIDRDPLHQRLTIDELKAWLNPLSDRERTIIALRYGADLDNAEIARVLGLSRSNVQQILSRSLRRLREGSASDAQTVTSPPHQPQRLTRRSTDS